MIKTTEIAGLWVPAKALSRHVVSEIPAGSLVLGRASGAVGTPSLGVRFDLNGFRFLFALTCFHDGRSQPGHAIDVTKAQTGAYLVDVPFTIETDLAAPARHYGRQEPAVGALVVGENGFGLVAHFRPPDSFEHRRVVDVTNWDRLNEDNLELEFSTWRLILEIPDRDPVGLQPFPAPTAGATSA